MEKKFEFLVGGDRKTYPGRYMSLKALKAGKICDAFITYKNNLLILNSSPKDCFCDDYQTSSLDTDTPVAVGFVLSNTSQFYSKEKLMELVDFSNPVPCKIIKYYIDDCYIRLVCEITKK